MAREAMVVCSSVWLGYGDQIVLRNVSLEVTEGCWIWLVGPNGAGKSTLLRALVGLLPPRSGSLRRSPRARPIGYVPQQHTLDRCFPMSAREIVEMGLLPRAGLWRSAPHSARAELDECLARLGLEGQAHKSYGELSGGMRQKTLIARALVSQARLFVLDEATSELDALSEQLVWQELARRVSEERCAVLAVYHGRLPDPISTVEEWVAEVNHGEVRLVMRETGT